MKGAYLPTQYSASSNIVGLPTARASLPSEFAARSRCTDNEYHRTEAVEYSSARAVKEGSRELLIVTSFCRFQDANSMEFDPDFEALCDPNLLGIAKKLLTPQTKAP